MKFSSDTSIKILESALEREKETRDYYRTCLDSATVKGTREILQGLVKDEMKHVEIVTHLLEEAKRDGQVDSKNLEKSPSAKSILDSAFAHKIVEDDSFSAEKATIQEMLKRALNNEKESFDNYAGAASDADDLEVKAIYNYLAQEENKHYVLIDNLITYLDDPGTWLYEEENQLFRL